MAATLIIVFGFFSTAVVTGISSNPINVAQNVTITITCTTNGRRTPDWFVNGTVVLTSGDRYRSSTRNGIQNKTATLTIDGNRTHNTLNIYCEVYNTIKQQFLQMHMTTLTIQGHLPSPESVHINSSTIEWSPPYSTRNNDIIHVDPHITQYTVYITDNCTGNIIVVKNVTETQFTPNIEVNYSCPIYQVSAWNAGGEGELSEPVQESSPQFPHCITPENISVAVIKRNVLHISIDVDGVCTSRTPEFFLITMMTSVGRVLMESSVRREPGQAVTNFTIHLPQSVDVCSLHVRIRAGNSAGMSAPSEAVQTICLGVSTATTITTTTTTSTESDAITNYVDDHQQGDSTALIVIVTGVVAIIGGVLIVAVTVGIICYRDNKKEKLKKSEIEMKPNKAYETVTRAQPATQVHMEPCLAYEVVVQAHH